MNASSREATVGGRSAAATVPNDRHTPAHAAAAARIGIRARRATARHRVRVNECKAKSSQAAHSFYGMVLTKKPVDTMRHQSPLCILMSAIRRTLVVVAGVLACA